MQYAPEYWHRQAQETREMAAMMSLPRDKRLLLEMAENYDRQARAADLRLHRASAQQSGVQLRAMTADVRVTIKETRVALENSREALHQANLLLSGSLFVCKRTVSWLE